MFVEWLMEAVERPEVMRIKSCSILLDGDDISIGRCAVVLQSLKALSVEEQRPCRSR
jgi:hypothetical protein